MEGRRSTSGLDPEPTLIGQIEALVFLPNKVQINVSTYTPPYEGTRLWRTHLCISGLRIALRVRKGDSKP